MESVDTAFLPLPEGIVLQSVHPSATAVLVQIACRYPSAACPRCEQSSERVHGHYTRTVADLPCGGRRVLLRFVVRKFVCPMTECPQQIFTERRAEFVQSYARMTNRLREALVALGMTTGGESGERLAPKLGMRVSAPTLLRHLRRVVLPDAELVRLLGVDDWAWKRGQTYGTILVDLEQHRPIDLLPDRTSATTEAWLRTHPEVDWVSRDRGGEYAAAARAGAPQARQVADKFHLLKNLREALQKLLERKQSYLPEEVEETRSDVIPPQARGRGAALPVPLVQPKPDHERHYLRMTAQPRLRPGGLSASHLQQQARRDNRYARYEAVRTLYQQGLKKSDIHRRLSLSRATITRYLEADTFPERPPPPKKASILDPYKPYLLQRWQGGCRNGVQLLAEITARGYQGSQALVAIFLADLRKKHQLVGDPQTLHLGVAPPHKASILDAYKPYVLKRWQEGCWNGVQLYAEIKAQGFPGSQPTLRDFLAELRKRQCLVGDQEALRVDLAPVTVVVPTTLPPKRAVTRRMAPARASWLLFLPTERLTDRELEQRERLRTCHPDAEAAYQLVSAFVTMLAERREEGLARWLAQASHSRLPDLKRFATGIRRDEAAVRAAFSSGISNAQTEGQVNRLKATKRSMYGRANFDLLRLRFLYRA
jgi:transposase